MLLRCQRELYNAVLEQRRGVWRWERRAVTKYEQYRELSGDRVGFEWLTRFGVGVARGTLTRLDEAFANFFRRVRTSERSGFPRFRGAGSWDSVQWEGVDSWKLQPTGKGTYGRLYVQGIGHVRVKIHRVFGDGAECRKLVIRRRGRRWDATVFWRGVQIPKLIATGRACGVDVGVEVLAAIADDQGGVELVADPRPLTARRAKLTAAHQALAACAKTGRCDGGRRQRARNRVSRMHEQIANRRRTFSHQLSARLVRAFDLIAFEDLHLTAMTRSARGTLAEPGHQVAAKAGLNRAILDAAWGQLLRLITYKAESAGRQIQRVHAPYTSQTCARCGYTDPDSRVTRDDFRCTRCGHRLHADANAAAVVLAVALGRFTIQASPARQNAVRPEPGHQPVTAGRDAAPAADRGARIGCNSQPILAGS